MDYTLEEWQAKGKSLFGEDMMAWEFKCPLCGNVQTSNDFKQYAPNGATPDSACKECIGRYTGGLSGPHKCDWCAYGLFRGPDSVDGTPVFPFNEEGNDD